VLRQDRGNTGRHRPLHRRRDTGRGILCRGAVSSRRRGEVDGRKQRRALLGSGGNHHPRRAAARRRGDLAQDEIEASGGPRPGAHGGAKAGVGGMAAVGGDDEGPLAPRAVAVVGGARVVPQNRVEDGDGGKIARADGEQR
jgi:hypothetical protein